MVKYNSANAASVPDVSITRGVSVHGTPWLYVLSARYEAKFTSIGPRNRALLPSLAPPNTIFIIAQPCVLGDIYPLTDRDSRL